VTRVGDDQHLDAVSGQLLDVGVGKAPLAEDVRARNLHFVEPLAHRGPGSFDQPDRASVQAF
jgi:hypothetical protein